MRSTLPVRKWTLVISTSAVLIAFTATVLFSLKEMTLVIRSPNTMTLNKLEVVGPTGRLIHVNEQPIAVHRDQLNFDSFSGFWSKGDYLIKVEIKDASTVAAATCSMVIHHRRCSGEIYIVNQQLRCTPCVRD